MADAQLGRPAIIAIGFAVVALLTSVVAVVVVVMRREPTVATAKPPPAPAERTIDAAEILKLKRDVVAPVDANGTFAGVKITDDALRTTFGLEANDIVTAINGRAIKREFDVFDAVLGLSTMNASIVYVEVMREATPILLRWKVDGDLRTARRDPSVRSAPNPFTAPRDPLVDTITKRGPLHYEIPKSTIHQLLANPDTFARQARIVPAMANGQPIGFKLYAVRPGSVWTAIDLANGDTMRSINGHDLSTPDRAIQLYAALKDATELQILVRRRIGIDETIVIAIK